MAVTITLSSNSTADSLDLTLGISNKGQNAAMAMWKVTLPDGLILEQPYEPFEGTMDLAVSVDAEIGHWKINLAKLSKEQRDNLLTSSVKAVGTVTGDGDTYAIEDVKEFKQLLNA